MAKHSRDQLMFMPSTLRRQRKNQFAGRTASGSRHSSGVSSTAVADSPRRVSLASYQRRSSSLGQVVTHRTTRNHIPGSRFCSGSGIAAAPGWDTRVRPSNLTARDPLEGAFTGGVSDWPIPSSRLRSGRVERKLVPAKRRSSSFSPLRSRTGSLRPTCGA